MACYYPRGNNVLCRTKTINTYGFSESQLFLLKDGFRSSPWDFCSGREMHLHEVITRFYKDFGIGEGDAAATHF